MLGIADSAPDACLVIADEGVMMVSGGSAAEPYKAQLAQTVIWPSHFTYSTHGLSANAERCDEASSAQEVTGVLPATSRGSFVMRWHAEGRVFRTI